MKEEKEKEIEDKEVAHKEAQPMKVDKPSEKAEVQKETQEELSPQDKLTKEAKVIQEE